MASTALDTKDAIPRSSIAHSEKYAVNPEDALPYSSSVDSLKPIYDDTHRKLKPRHIQLIGIGGSVVSLTEFCVHEADVAVEPSVLRYSSRLVGRGSHISWKGPLLMDVKAGD